MIDALDATLRELLREELPSSIRDQVAITFAPPTDQFIPAQNTPLPAIDLFLYDIRENMDLRSNDFVDQRSSSGAVKRRLPLVRVDCSYLITAWPRTTAVDSAEDEHRLLSATMLALLRHRTLPSVLLQGMLRSQELPLPAATLQPGRLQSLGEFWQALGGKPKAALNYTVTVAVQPADEYQVPLTTVGRTEAVPADVPEAGQQETRP
jgi:hypothetical protein